MKKIHRFQSILTSGLFTLIGVILFSSCEKTVTVKLPEVDDKIVVEGYVQNDFLTVVRLSKTLKFFGSVNVNDVLSTSISGATVIVDDGFISDTLQELGVFGGVYFSSRIIGVPGRTYRLSVYAEGQTLTASTYLPQPIPLDSVWWKVDGLRDSLGFAWAHLSDPDTVGNCYRWFAQRINQYTFGDDAGKQKDTTFYAPLGSVFEDKFINGKSFDFSVARGRLYNSTKADDLNQESFFFKRGDTILVKFCAIDREHFNFWRSEETQVSNNGNAFGSPNPIISNINGGLGIWGGYTTTYDTIYAR